MLFKKQLSTICLPLKWDDVLNMVLDAAAKTITFVESVILFLPVVKVTKLSKH